MAQGYLEQLFDADVKDFSDQLSAKFGQVIAKHGIKDPKVWLATRMRTAATGYTHGDAANAHTDTTTRRGYCAPDGRIALYDTTDRATRAHEMVHKMGQEAGRSGLLVDNADGTDRGYAINEGVTETLTTQLAAPRATAYTAEISAVRELARAVGMDTIVEAVLFGHEILARRVNALGGPDAYDTLIAAMDTRFDAARKKDLKTQQTCIAKIGKILHEITRVKPAQSGVRDDRSV